MSVFVKNPEIAASLFLIFHRMEPALDAVRARLIEDDKADEVTETAWFNGAMFGIAAQLLRGENEAATDEEISTLYAAVCELFDEVWGDDGEHDINLTMRRLVPDAFADEVAS